MTKILYPPYGPARTLSATTTAKLARRMLHLETSAARNRDDFTMSATDQLSMLTSALPDGKMSI